MKKNNKRWSYSKIISIFLLAGSLITQAACDSVSTNTMSQNSIAANYNVQLGLGYLEQNQKVRAKQKLLLALHQAPNWPIALNAMAYFLEKTGEDKEAAYYYQSALKNSPHDGASLNNYGAFLCRKGNYQLAKQYFLKAVNEINYVNSAEAYENAGLCSLQAYDELNGETFFLKALEQDPMRLASMFELAKIYFNKNNLKKADFYIKRYNQYSTPDAQALWLGIRIARKLGDLDTIGKNGMILQRYYAGSKEFKLYQKMQS